MYIFYALFAGLAAVGLLLSLLAHVAGLLGLPGPLGDSTIMLHVGIFVVWLPTVLVMQRLVPRDTPRQNTWKLALRGCPAWMKYMTSAFLAYAVINFVIFFFSVKGGGREGSGPMSPNVMAGFSGHWMAFYSAAFSTLYSAARLLGPAPPPPPRRCPAGHPVEPTDPFCRECGEPVEPD